MYSSIFKFTAACVSHKLPKKPQPMNRYEVEYLVSNVFSEMIELLETVCDNNDDRNKTALKLLTSTHIHNKFTKPICPKKIVVGQVDAIIDTKYLMMNIAARSGINTELGFQAVHKTNMQKINKETGKVTWMNGRILKPNGWIGPENELEKIYFPETIKPRVPRELHSLQAP